MTRMVRYVARRVAVVRHRVVQRQHAVPHTIRNVSALPLQSTVSRYSTAVRGYATQSQVDEDEKTVALQLLKQSLADRQAGAALAHFDRLQTVSDQPLAQRLAILLAKSGDKTHARRAFEILRNVYLLPKLQKDDYTQLASIYVVDACIRHRMLEEALEIHEEAMNVDVFLDIPCYEALVRALMHEYGDHEDATLEDVTQLLMDVCSTGIVPPERMFAPLLDALVDERDYDTAKALLKTAQRAKVKFTSETFIPLVDKLKDDEGSADLFAVVDSTWEEAKALDELFDRVLGDVDDDDDGTMEDRDRDATIHNLVDQVMERVLNEVEDKEDDEDDDVNDTKKQ